MKKVVLFGAGDGLEKFILMMKLLHYEIVYIVDNSESKWGKFISGYKIEAPQTLMENSYDIVISCGYVDEIHKQLKEMSIADRIFSFEQVDAGLSDAAQFIPERFLTDDGEDVAIKEKRTIFFDTLHGVGWGGIEMWSYRIADQLDAEGENVVVYGTTEQEKVDQQYERLIKRIDWNEMSYESVIALLYQELYKAMPLVIFDNWTDHLFMAGYLLKKKYPNQVKLLSVLHNDKEVLYRTKKLWSDSFDAILAVSKRMAGKLIDNYGLDGKKIFYKAQYLHYDCKEKLRTNVPIKLNIGWGARVEVEQKRADLIPQLILALEEKEVNYSFNIAGEGSYKLELLNWVINQGLENKIHFLGYVMPDRMKDFWREQDVYINLSDFEGASLAMIEAMANGAIPVVTDVSGADEFVVEGITGFCFMQDEIFKMAEKIKKISQEEYYRRELSKNAVEIIKKKCNFIEYVEFIKNCIAQTGLEH